MSTTPTHRPLRIAAALAAAAAAAALGAAPAPASIATNAVCTARFVATITPGFTMAPSSETLTTNGETGSLICVGSIDGHGVTGPGAMGFVETDTGGTCRGHVGTGTLSITLPTSAGVEHIAGTLGVKRTALIVRAEVRAPELHFSGVGLVAFRQGNCFLTPLRQVMVTVTGSFAAA